jgi:23S rRNA pseudouridine1911/1915/1917 synthase
MDNFQIIYEDSDLLAIDKPPGIVVFPEEENGQKEKTLIDFLLEKFPDLKNVGEPPRYGIAHRLDKDTSGILLVAKTDESLSSLQKQFENRETSKKYIALATGIIKQDSGRIETLLGRSPQNRQKQKAYVANEPGGGNKREAVTDFQVLKRFKDYTLVELFPKTGRKHQIRVHLAYLGHPIAGDKLYGFKNQPCPKGLKRQFLHAAYLKVKSIGGKELELESRLPEDLETIIKQIPEEE